MSTESPLKLTIMNERSEFILSPSLEQLEKLEKDDLLDIAKELDIDCKRSWLKLKLKWEICM